MLWIHGCRFLWSDPEKTWIEFPYAIQKTTLISDYFPNGVGIGIQIMVRIPSIIGCFTDSMTRCFQ